MKKAADGLSPTTVEKYRRTWRLDIDHALGGTSLAAITRADVRDLVKDAEIRSSAWQAAEALKLTRRLLNAAVDAEYIARNVAARIPLPEGQRKPITILKPEELHRAADKLPDRYRLLALLGGYSSLRWSELVALKRDDLDVEARTIRVDERLTEVGGGGAFDWRKPKTTRSARNVDLPAVVVRLLAEHLLRFPPLRSENPQLEGLIFHSEEGGPVRRHTFRREWGKACSSGRPGHPSGVAAAHGGELGLRSEP